MFSVRKGGRYIGSRLYRARRRPAQVESGPELYQEVASAFSNYLEKSVLTSLDSDLLEFLMQISVVDEFTLELAEMVTANGHALELLEQALEAGNFLTQEDGVYRLRSFQLHALRSRAAKVLGMNQVRTFAASAGHYYAIHDQIVPALKLYEFSGSTECIRELPVRNARLNPGNGHYYELRRISSFEASVREQNALQFLLNIQALKCRLALFKGDMKAVTRWMETAPDENKEGVSEWKKHGLSQSGGFGALSPWPGAIIWSTGGIPPVSPWTMAKGSRCSMGEPG